VQQIASPTKKALRWVFILGGTLVGIFGLVILDRRWGYPESLSDWFFLFAAALFGFIPLFASVIAARSPSRAGLLFLFSTPFALAASFLTQIDRLRYGMILWYVLLGYSSLSTLVIFVLPGLFWLGTQRLNWAPVMSRPESVSPGHKILRIGRMAVLLSCLVLIGAVVLAVLTPPFFMDCNKSAPISAREPGQVVFVARIVRTLGPCEEYSGHHACGGAVAIVRERFWGIRSSVVLLTQGFFENGEQYLLDGVRATDPLTRFLPIVGFRPCNHSARLKDAAVDLRVLRDRSPRLGVRIIGSVTRYNGKEREAAPGRKVAITGPSGTVTVTTDNQGIYDLTGLPPGHYEIRSETPGSRFWHNQCGSGEELKSGTVGGCALDSE
jgi:hypothetical protein